MRACYVVRLSSEAMFPHWVSSESVIGRACLLILIRSDSFAAISLTNAMNLAVNKTPLFNVQLPVTQDRAQHIEGMFNFLARNADRDHIEIEANFGLPSNSGLSS